MPGPVHGHGPGSAYRLAGVGLILCLVMLLAPTRVESHKVSLFATGDGDSVRAEAYFADGSPCENAVVSALDAAGEELASAETDSLGQVTFARLEREAVRLVVEAGMGHRAEFSLMAEEAGEASTAGMAAESPAMAEPVRGGGEGVTSVTEGVQASHANAELVGLLEASLDRRLEPVEASVRRLERAHEKAGTKDAIAGVGFIVGLAGLWALLTNRRRKGQ